MAIFKARSQMLCRVRDYAAWQLRTFKFPLKRQDSMIADAA
jgi:hypothetical protein